MTNKNKAKRFTIKLLFWLLGAPLFIYLAILYLSCGDKKRDAVDLCVDRAEAALDELMKESLNSKQGGD